MSALVSALGALARRFIGWSETPRWVGIACGTVGVLIVMWPHGVLASLFAAVAIALGWGLPWHGESMRKPWLMSLRNGALTAAMATVLTFGFNIEAWAYAPVGLVVGPAYWLAYKLRDRLPINDFMDDWSAYGELALGVALVGGLALV